jgi:hypothetical protein
VVLEKEEASGPPAIGARRAGALLRAARGVQGAAAHRAAVAEEEVLAVGVVVAVVGAVAVAEVAVAARL